LPHPPPKDGDGDEVDQLQARVLGLERAKEELVEQLEKCKIESAAQKQVASDEVAQVRGALQEGFDLVKRQNGDLRQELDRAQEHERELRTTLQRDYEQRSGKDVAKWESTVRRLEEEKDILASKLEDYSKLKSQSERLRDKVEEMDASSKGLKERLAVLEDSNAKRLDRILELEGMEKDRGFNKKKMEQYKNAAKDLELRVLKMASEAQVKDQEAASLAEALKDARGKARYLEHELEDSKRELQEAADLPAAALAGLGPAHDFVPPELAEKLVRLARENGLLKAQLADASSGAESAQVEALCVAAEDRERRVAAGEQETQRLKRELAKAQAEAAVSSERAEARIKELEAEVHQAPPPWPPFAFLIQADLPRRSLRCSRNCRAIKRSRKR
jgi:chromosome segregation ATPase